MSLDERHASITVANEDPPLEESARKVREGLIAYNRSKTTSDFAKVQVIARDAAGEVCGGAVGYVAWGELYIDMLWVDERDRGQGIGTRLMAQVEEVAVARRCHRVHLGTMSHQAPEFYAKIGYLQYAFLPGANGWPDRFLFCKELDAQAPALEEQPA